MVKCMFCEREGSNFTKTKAVGGYTILEYCTDCEKEILYSQGDVCLNEGKKEEQI